MVFLDDLAAECRLLARELIAHGKAFADSGVELVEAHPVERERAVADARQGAQSRVDGRHNLGSNLLCLLGHLGLGDRPRGSRPRFVSGSNERGDVWQPFLIVEGRVEVALLLDEDLSRTLIVAPIKHKMLDEH